MTRWLAPLVLVASSTLLGGCYYEERAVYAPTIPEQDAAEIVEVSPVPGSVYVSGHWEWNGARYVWAHAHYLRRPQANLFWAEGHWQSTPQGWYWQEGHWVDAKAVHPHSLRPRRLQQVPPPQPPASTEVPEGEIQSDPNVPPAPTYAPPPPPANIPPPPGAAVAPQHYMQHPATNIGY